MDVSNILHINQINKHLSMFQNIIYKIKEIDNLQISCSFSVKNPKQVTALGGVQDRPPEIYIHDWNWL